MREQLREDFNQQQLILARQAALRIDEELKDISAEVHRLNQALAEAAPSTALHTYMRTTLDYTHDKGLKESDGSRRTGRSWNRSASPTCPSWNTRRFRRGVSRASLRPSSSGRSMCETEIGETVVVGLVCSPMRGDTSRARPFTVWWT